MKMKGMFLGEHSRELLSPTLQKMPNGSVSDAGKQS